ncbi:hypothetical protein FGB62_18g22 [Gracilaria domingensis]|nr:hypothetical protein FGB62_18g22 [Gracilaria domingensis]
MPVVVDNNSSIGITNVSEYHRMKELMGETEVRGKRLPLTFLSDQQQHSIRRIMAPKFPQHVSEYEIRGASSFPTARIKERLGKAKFAIETFPSFRLQSKSSKNARHNPNQNWRLNRMRPVQYCSMCIMERC